MENHILTDKNNREEEARKGRERERIPGKGRGREKNVVGTVEGEEEDHKLTSNFYKLRNL